MQVKGRCYDGTLYVLLKGELDEYSSVYTRDVLDKLLSGSGFKQVIMDLSELEFMDSTGVGVLIGRYKKMKAKNIPIYLCNPNSSIERIFRISGLYEIMPKIS